MMTDDAGMPKIDPDQRALRVELLISRLLQAGVVTSLFCIAFGTTLSFKRHPDYRSTPSELARLTSPGAAFPHTLGEVWAGAKQFRGQAIVAVGLLILIATPVLRVAVSIIAFVYQRDWIFVGITTAVLVLLLLSFVLGRAAG
jgi:uncharacterized membrane protein